MSITLGNAVLYLSGDNSRLTSDLNSAKAQTQSWAGSVGSLINNTIGTALGVFTTQVVGAAIQGIRSVAVEALSSVADYERLGMSLQTLVARELMRGETSTQTSTVIQHLTQAEIDKVRQLTDEQAIAQGNVLSLQAKFDAEWAQVQASGQAWSAELTTLNAQIDLAKMKADGYGKEIDALNARNGQAATVTKEITINTMGHTEAMAAAIPKAQELLDWIQKLAVESPYGPEDVANSFRLAMAYGFTTTEAKRLTQATIDFASGSGASSAAMGQIALALGQIKAKGKLAGQEVLQLVNAGLPITQILADAFHKTTAEITQMQTQGLLPAKDVIEAVAASLEHDFGGAAKRQATSWAGLVETLKQIKDIGLREFFTGMFTAIQPYVVSFVDAFTNGGLQDKLKGIGDAIGKNVGGAMLWLKDNALPVLQEVFKWFKYIQWAVKDGQDPLDVLGKILKVLLPPEFQAAAAGVINFLKQFEPLGKLAGVALAGLAALILTQGGPAFTALMDAVRPLGEAVSRLVGALVGDAPKMLEAGKMIGEIGGYILAAIGPEVIANVTGAINTLTDLWQTHGATILGTVVVVFALIGATIGGAVIFISAIFENFVNGIKGIMDVGSLMLQGRWGEAWDTLRAIPLTATLNMLASFDAFLNMVLGMLGTNAEEFRAVWRSNWDMFWLIAKTSWDNMIAGITTVLAIFGFMFGDFFATLGNTWRSNWDTLGLILKTAWAGMWTAIGVKITEIKTAISTFFTDVKKKFTDEYANFMTIGSLLIDNVLKGIMLKVSQVIAAVENMVKDAMAAAAKALGLPWPGSTSSTTDTTDNTSHRASGGPVKRGQSYIVGEKRPEWFVPDTNGFILPGVPQIAPMTVSGAGGQSQQPTVIYLLMDGELVGKMALDGVLNELGARGKAIALPVA